MVREEYESNKSANVGIVRVIEAIKVDSPSHVSAFGLPRVLNMLHHLCHFAHKLHSINLPILSFLGSFIPLILQITFHLFILLHRHH